MNYILTHEECNFGPRIIARISKICPNSRGNFTLLLYKRSNRKVVYDSTLFKHDYPKVNLNDLKKNALTSDDSVICLSLSSLSSSHALQVYEALPDKTRFFIMLFDDEVERWTSLAAQHGALVADNQFLVDDAVVKLLEEVRTFLVARIVLDSFVHPFPYEHFHPNLEVIEAYPRISAIDSLANYGFTPLSLSDYKLQNNIDREHSAMIFTKPYDIRELTLILEGLIYTVSAPKFSQTYKKLKVGVWLNPLPDSSRQVIQKLNLLRSALILKGIALEVEFLAKSNTLLYFGRLLSYRVLVAQRRGGFTTMLDFMQCGGSVVFTKGSPNEKFANYYTDNDVESGSSSLEVASLCLSAKTERHDDFCARVGRVSTKISQKWDLFEERFKQIFIN